MNEMKSNLEEFVKSLMNKFRGSHDTSNRKQIDVGLVHDGAATNNFGILANIVENKRHHFLNK